MEKDGHAHRRGPRLPLRLLLHSTHRCASNIWMRQFEKHPSISSTQYFFHNAFFWGPERAFGRPFKDYDTPIARERVKLSMALTYQHEFQRMLDFISDAESQNKIPLFKDNIFELLKYHEFAASVPGSKTATLPNPNFGTEEFPNEPSENDSSLRHPFILPSSFLTTLAPIIIIRHPARKISSFYRVNKVLFDYSVSSEEFKIIVGPHFPRVAYNLWADYFHESEGRWPIVVDFDSLSRDVKGTMGRFCERVGIDESGIAYEMERVSKTRGYDESLAVDRLMQGKAFGSTGIFTDEESVREPDVDEEERKWAELYGKDEAKLMRGLLDESMEDYEFLRSKSV